MVQTERKLCVAKTKKKLGEILTGSGVITEETLRKALDIQRQTGGKLGEILVSRGFITEEQIVDAVREQLGIQSVDLNRISIEQEIINIIPEAIARKHEVLPLDIVNGKLMVAMADPLNYYAIEELKLFTGYSVKAAIVLRSSLISNIERYYGKTKAEEAAEDYGRIYGFRKKSNGADLDDESAPITKFINTIIENALLNGSSDIHIEPGESELRVRFRIDGVLKEIMKTDIGILEPVCSRIKIMANLNIAERRLPQDGRINYGFNGKSIDIRVSTVPTIWGEKVVLRLLDKSGFSFHLETLGMERDDLDRIREILSRPYGIVLVSGPTGSGKTTSLYSFLNELNDVKKNIITIEDPVEYNMRGINQMQVNPRIGFSFANGLRSILRQDPDIIMVGEIRDDETAEISVRSAMTGHLVLSTVHTNNAAGTVTRLMDMGIEPFLLTSTVIGIIAQRLVRKVCPVCSEEYISEKWEMNVLRHAGPVALKRAKGCSLCNHTGYKGRTGIYEVMQITEEIRDLIGESRSEKEIEEAAIRNGMTLLREACIRKVLAGTTTMEEMMRVTYGY